VNVAIIGKGNLGSHLYNALKPHCDMQWYDRSYPKIIDADIVIVSVSDDSTLEVLSSIQGPLTVHTAGTVPMANLERTGVFYPLYSFTKEASVQWKTIPFLLESSRSEDMPILEEITRLIGARVFHITSDQRIKLHAAAVMVNNFTNHLYTLAKEHCDHYNLPFEVLNAIMRQGPDKAIALGPEVAQTGPARRGDNSTVERHLEQLQNPATKALYQTLSENIKKRYEL
tara:strand:- start:2737 stop:3420 length:684 start_codon:yes stop_codon:yes gene_type:complete